MTYIGKLFVLVNVAVSMLLLSWALVLFATHNDPADAVDTSVPGSPKVTVRVTDLNKSIADAKSGYLAKLTEVADAESKYSAYTAQLSARLDEADKSKFYEIIEGGAPRGVVDPLAIAQSGRLNVVDPKPVLGSDGKPLPGVDVSKKNLLDAAARARTSRAALAANAKVHDDLSDEITARPTGYVARYDRFRRMFGELASEKDHLADELIGYDEQLASLDRRHEQLVKRLDTLKTKPFGLVMPPSDPTAATRR